MPACSICTGAACDRSSRKPAVLQARGGSCAWRACRSPPACSVMARPALSRQNASSAGIKNRIALLGPVRISVPSSHDHAPGRARFQSARWALERISTRSPWMAGHDRLQVDRRRRRWRSRWWRPGVERCDLRGRVGVEVEDRPVRVERRSRLPPRRTGAVVGAGLSANGRRGGSRSAACGRRPVGRVAVLVLLGLLHHARRTRPRSAPGWDCSAEKMPLVLTAARSAYRGDEPEHLHGEPATDVQHLVERDRQRAAVHRVVGRARRTRRGSMCRAGQVPHPAVERRRWRPLPSRYNSSAWKHVVVAGHGPVVPVGPQNSLCDLGRAVAESVLRKRAARTCAVVHTGDGDERE